MTIYCSKKLETFLGTVEVTSRSTPSPLFGDWNGHLFALERKQCLLLTSNLTGYSLLITDVLKKDMADFGVIFKERLLRQLGYDFNLSEQQEVMLRSDLKEVVLNRSNNDKRIITTMNHLIADLKYIDFGEALDDLRVTRILNERPLGARLPIANRSSRNYFVPSDVVRALLSY